MKRLFDLLASSLALVLLAPLLALVALAIKLDSPGPVFYRGRRAGRGGGTFRILKFRTMVAGAAARGGITVREDPRITRVGRRLRSLKLDELPQLWNVVRGEMSLVGPRPEDPRYVAHFTERQKAVLSVRPGITSVASLRYRKEAELLDPSQWERIYLETVLPAKLDLELNYVAHQCISQDLAILLATCFSLLRDHLPYRRWSARAGRLELVLGRYVSWALADAFLIFVAYVLAIAIRSLDARVPFVPAMRLALPGVGIYLLASYLFGIYRVSWRYASGQESVVLFESVAAATVALFVVDLFDPQRDLPLGAIVIGGGLTFLLLGGIRFRRQLWAGLRPGFASWSGMASGEGARVLIVGAGEEGQILAWQLRNRALGKAYEVVGFVDSDRRKHGMRIHNVPVHGDRALIPDLVHSLHVDLIIIAIPPEKIADRAGLFQLCRSTAARVKVLPGIANLLGETGSAPGWVDIDEGDLLEREPYRVNEQACTDLLSGRVVMVTGAAGSIGTELCRQIAGFKPARLVLVDFNESGLHDLQVELLARHPDLSVELALQDITEAHGLDLLFRRIRPQLVFHVAAYKHVPILETQPREGIRVNVQGTRLVHQLAGHYGADKFVLISSDKAVDPINVLGLTKRLGELIVIAHPHEGGMLSTAVRFGNVLGSRGSVIPTFERQIELGGPITITDPEMTRYFLSIGEAVSLVLQAVAMTRGGDLYVLDMGEPIKIADLAQRLIRLRGLRPGVDIPIRYTGLRPGEKMDEQLVAGGEARVPTEHPSIFRICQSSPLNLSPLESQLDGLIEFSSNGATPEEVRAELRRVHDLLEPQTLAG